ncbi:lysoplasmalogenase [Paracoccus sp. M683]|uniref:lysoplasmalogenase n=1 Tax=Paracoccus sp. M683 TaxID=2594268 RepID=UPI00163D821B|nr:lysoplasmalogenase [Paracoccus sp. M683]
MIWLAVGFAVIFWLRHAGRPPSWAGSIAKTASTALLAATGAITGAPWLVVAGLALGSAGDFALSRPGQVAFLAGMAAFAAGHLAYVAQMWTPAGAGQLWPLGLAMMALAISTELWLIPRTGDLKWPVRGYVLVITAMALAALTLPPERGLMALGAGLFVLSDLLLAIWLFIQPRRALALALWPAYWCGQALILAGSP